MFSERTKSNYSVLVLYKQTYVNIGLSSTYIQAECNIFGSSRVGVYYPPDRSMISDSPERIATRYRNYRRYEVSNHLGNVMSVVTDRLKGNPTALPQRVSAYEPDIVAAQDYYPFGQVMRGRNFPTMLGKSNFPTKYRYGFNDKEADADGEIQNLTTYDYGFRIYNPGIARFLSVDPLANKYPAMSPFTFGLNNPNIYIDPGGDTVKISVTVINVGTTEINLFSGDEVKDKIDEKTKKVIVKGIDQKTKIENVYQVNVESESGCNATFYYTRIAHRGDKDNPDADPKEVTFDPETDGQIFLGEVRSRFKGVDNVLELTPLSGNREDGYNAYTGLSENRILSIRKFIQFHLKGASDGCLLCVGSDQFNSTENGLKIDKTDISGNSKDSQANFMNKIIEFKADDKLSGNSEAIIIKVDRLKK